MYFIGRSSSCFYILTYCQWFIDVGNRNFLCKLNCIGSESCSFALSLYIALIWAVKMDGPVGFFPVLSKEFKFCCRLIYWWIHWMFNSLTLLIWGLQYLQPSSFCHPSLLRLSSFFILHLCNLWTYTYL